MEVDRPPDIVIVAGGSSVPAHVRPLVGPDTTVVAADAGVATALDLGWTVSVAIGDFDSLDSDLVARLDEVAGTVVRADVDKDETDLELALLAVGARSESGSRVLVVGLEGGRPDHALANLLVAASRRHASLAIELGLESGRAWVVHDRLRGDLIAGSVVSVLPVHGDAVVSFEGVRWSLSSSLLLAGTTRGLSNQVTDGPVELVVHRGTVVCVAPFPEPSPRDLPPEP